MRDIKKFVRIFWGYSKEDIFMQIISIDYDDKAFRCGRIQNTAKPEFVKLKQFNADKRGLKSLDDWIDECCQKDHANITIAVIVEDQQGASIAYHFYQKGCVVCPMTYRGVARSQWTSRDRCTAAEMIARKAVTSKETWAPMNNACLALREALIEREAARLGCLQNQEKNQNYQQNQALDFLFQLTQNASNILADRVAQAENKIHNILEQSHEFKTERDLLMTIPNMSESTAAALLYLIDVYQPKSAEKFVSMLNLHNGKAISEDNYRAPELRIARNALFEFSADAEESMDEIKALASRLDDKAKSYKTIAIAISHKIARIAFAILKSRRAYHKVMAQ